MRKRFASLLLISTALLLAFGFADRALAADSHAPPGAPVNWLPPDDWVNQHWLPYNRNLLLRTLHMDTGDVRRFFAHATRRRVPPLARRVRARGLSVSGLARRLVQAGLPNASDTQRAELVKRARWTLTQGHLLQHMLFHYFHDRALYDASQRIFGVSPEALAQRVHSTGRSRRQIGHAHGRSDRQMVAAIKAVLRAEEREGVASQVTPRSEAHAELSSQLPRINAFLDARKRTRLDFPRKAGARGLYFCHVGGG